MVHSHSRRKSGHSLSVTEIYNHRPVSQQIILGMTANWIYYLFLSLNYYTNTQHNYTNTELQQT
jgi:hypothetical protein